MPKTKRFISQAWYSLVVSVFVFSCSQDKCSQIAELPPLEETISVDRLEDNLDFKSVDDVLHFLKGNRITADYFLDANQYPNDTILAQQMFRLFAHPSIDSLIDESKAYFVHFEDITSEFENAYRFIRLHYPNAKIPKITTIVSGLHKDMYVSDSLVVIGLDYFMGMNGLYHPNDIPLYIVRRYMKESISPFVLSFISNEYNQIDRQHTTLLADMVNIGKSYYFVSQALPCKADSLIIGYTAEEMRLVRENQETIWANLVQNELLYETDHFLKNKFIGESPNIVEISEKCPGRVGAWLGWQIVRKYMNNNPNVSFKTLMAETDAHKIFQLSAYKPRNLN